MTRLALLAVPALLMQPTRAPGPRARHPRAPQPREPEHPEPDVVLGQVDQLAATARRAEVAGELQLAPTAAASAAASATELVTQPPRARRAASPGRAGYAGAVRALGRSDRNAARVAAYLGCVMAAITSSSLRSNARLFRLNSSISSASEPPS
jgi:hypothetical protein